MQLLHGMHTRYSSANLAHFFFAIENYIYNFVLVSRERFPMYGELKLAFFIYLWSPKTQVIRKQQTLSGKYKKQKQSDHICNWQLWF